MDTLKLGKKGEEIAEDYLKEQGYLIIARNWKPKKWGEIDLIALESDTLVFIEVKTLSSDKFIKPYERVDFHKLKVLKRAGKIFRKAHQNLPEAMRIDVVSVELDYSGKTKNIELFVGVE